MNFKSHYPCIGIVRDNRGFDPALLSNSPLLGQLFISNIPTKVLAVIPRNCIFVGIRSIVYIVHTIKMNTCAIYRLYHIMHGFYIELMNYMNRQLGFNIQMETQLCKNIYVKFPTTQAEVREQIKSIVPIIPTLPCSGLV